MFSQCQEAHKAGRPVIWKSEFQGTNVTLSAYQVSKETNARTWQHISTFGSAIPRSSNNSGCLIGSSMTYEDDHIPLMMNAEECEEIM